MNGLTSEILTKYKLTDSALRTYNDYQWEVGVERRINSPGTDLCSDSVLHYYDSPELAQLLNCIHADYHNPRLFEVECDSVAHDGLKGGSKRMTLIRELTFIRPSVRQSELFGLLCALEVYFIWAADDTNNSWILWAQNRRHSIVNAAYAAANAANAAYAAAYAANAAYAASSVRHNSLDLASLAKTAIISRA